MYILYISYHSIPTEFWSGIGIQNTEKYRPIPTEKYRIGMQLYFFSYICLCVHIDSQNSESICTYNLFTLGGGLLEMGLDRAERVWEGSYQSFVGSNRAIEKIKMERSTGP